MSGSDGGTKPSPPVVCVVGKKKSGKTAVAVALVRELGARGRRVMTLKHGHGFELDTPGTDSWRHRHEGGAQRVVLSGPEGMAVLGDWGPEGELPLRTLVERYVADAEVVVAEGWKASDEHKIEVYRSAAHAEPIYDSAGPRAATFLAVVTDREDYRPPGVRVLALGSEDLPARLADLVESLLE